MKLSTNKLPVILGACAGFAIAPLTAQAQWTLIDDFEGYEELTYTGETAVYPIHHNQGLGAMDVFGGIEGATKGGKAAWFWYLEGTNPPGSTCGGGAADVWHHIPFPQAIEPQTTSTIFFRTWQQSYALNWHAMWGKVAIEDVLAAPCAPAWGNQTAIIRYNSAEPLQVDARHATTYVNSAPNWFPELETWYNWWVVIHNDFDVTDPENPIQAGVGYYNIYRQGPDDAAPVLMTFQAGEDTVSDLGFRNTTFTSIKNLVLVQNNSDGDGIWLIDDLYQAVGPDLTNPTADVDPTVWCGMAKTGADVDTGSFMGWIYVGDLTGAGWAYSYSLGGFAYISACPGDSGAWVYVLN